MGKGSRRVGHVPCSPLRYFYSFRCERASQGPYRLSQCCGSRLLSPRSFDTTFVSPYRVVESPPPKTRPLRLRPGRPYSPLVRPSSSSVSCTFPHRPPVLSVAKDLFGSCADSVTSYATRSGHDVSLPLQSGRVPLMVGRLPFHWFYRTGVPSSDEVLPSVLPTPSGLYPSRGPSRVTSP